ncbi:MAG: DUF4381 domain-containing protein [bacterium]|nr:DUF4381 domain-containing protein [Gammaproteobacteria bacterium]HIL96240.1 DUF4381 domain-containing protein [Pseudomonadales bacterium]
MNELENLNLIELLDLLVDIHIPEPVSYWPQTTTWSVIFFIILGLAATFSWLQWVNYKNNAYRRRAIKELGAIKQQDDIPKQISAIASIIKRVAIVSFGRNQVAESSGSAWLTFLDQSCEDLNFSTGPGKHLAFGPYKKTIEASPGEVLELLEVAENWVASHEGSANDA